MADLASASTQQLFNLWRQGDAHAGQAMAQRFSDWYYAVSASRLGDTNGRGPLQRACVRFQQGILSVSSPGDLVEWAHGLIAEEVGVAGGRIPGGDFPCALTQERSPSDLLHEAARALPPAETRLLAQAYDADVSLDEVKKQAEAQGGYPLAVLRARYAVKRALRDGASVPFSVVPESPNLDAAPLPLYEAGRMTNPAEENGFEKWMLSDMTLCKDIAEFGVFAQALRAGALRRPSTSAPALSAPAVEAPAPAASRAEAAPSGSGSKLPLLIGALVVLGLLGVAILGAGFYFFR